jgi:hypothetical protein
MMNVVALALLLICVAGFAGYRATRPNTDFKIMTQWVSDTWNRSEWVWAPCGGTPRAPVICQANAVFYLQIHNGHDHQINVDSISAKAYDADSRKWYDLTRLYAPSTLFYGQQFPKLREVSENNNMQFLTLQPLQPYHVFRGLVLYYYPHEMANVTQKPSLISLTATDLEGDKPMVVYYHASDSDFFNDPNLSLMNIPFLTIEGPLRGAPRFQMHS